MASYIVTLGLLTIAAAVAVPTLIFPASTLRYIRRKRYQYEVTFGLYMLTPREKFVLDSLLFLTVSLIFLACVLYLPNHIHTVFSRAMYYYYGHRPSFLTSSASASAEKFQVHEMPLPFIPSQ